MAIRFSSSVHTCDATVIRYHRIGGNIANFNVYSCKSLTSDTPDLN